MTREQYKRQLRSILEQVDDMSDSIFSDEAMRCSHIDICIEFSAMEPPTVTVNRRMNPISVLRSCCYEHG